jgi:hypothetical protein
VSSTFTRRWFQLLRTDRQDLSEEEIWRLYILLTRVEAAFRAMKSPLMERPIFHHLQHRMPTHIFLCVLAYLRASAHRDHADRRIVITRIGRS